MIDKRCFVDTNILAYLIDTRDLKKQAVARKLVDDLIKNSTMIISTQSISELYNALTKKIGVDKINASEITQGISRSASEIIQVTPEIIYEAMEIHAAYSFSFYDSQMLSAAIEAKCAIFYSEDLSSGQGVRGVRITNPFENAS